MSASGREPDFAAFGENDQEKDERMVWIYGGLAFLLVLSFYFDARYRIIPNRCTAAGFLYGVAVRWGAGGTDGLLAALSGAAAGFGLMLVLYAIGAVGAGDVKLFGAIGSIAGGEFVLNGALNSVLLAGLIGFGIMAFRKQLLLRLRNAIALLFQIVLLRDIKSARRYKRNGGATFPFMYAVLPAVAVTMGYCEPAL
jgi:prepilin peptidase CpaA